MELTPKIFTLSPRVSILKAQSEQRQRILEKLKKEALAEVAAETESLLSKLKRQFRKNKFDSSALAQVNINPLSSFPSSFC